jgi:3-oxoadipyl-CoA thiolase
MSAAYLCDGIRTPFGRYGGALAKVRPDDMAALVLAALTARNPALDPAAIDEVVLGCANQAGEDNRNVARMVALLAGLPPSVPGVTVNRLCASGLDAVGYAARAIISGQADLIFAGGVESMSRAPFVMGKADSAFSRAVKIEDTTIGWRFVNPAMRAAYGVDSMPETGENVAADYNISRADQDAFALRSQQRNAAATARGFFENEIVPVSVPNGKNPPIIVGKDEHPRADTTLEILAKLKPVVREGGTVTAGNASGVNDGAAALIIASEDAIKRHGLTPRARILGFATAGVAPRVMGVGPVPAVQRLMARTKLTIADFDIVELNEAFAAQALAVLRALGLADDAAHVNSNGGAIAIGHPLGASGARLALTATRLLQENKAKRALVTLCVGVGQGAALAIERV